MIINGKRIGLAKLEEIKKTFIDWAFNHSVDVSVGRYEIAQEIWIDKEIEIYKLKQEIKRKNIEIEHLEETVLQLIEEAEKKSLV